MLVAIRIFQRTLFKSDSRDFITAGSIRYLKITSTNIVIKPKPRHRRNSVPVSSWASPNGLKRKRNRNMNKPKRRIKTNFSFEDSTLPKGFIFSITRSLIRQIYVIFGNKKKSF
jgi:hypothetical protein